MGVFMSLSAPFIKESKLSGAFSQKERMAFSLLKSINKDCPFLKNVRHAKYLEMLSKEEIY
jgi:hypothetical protein